LNLLSSTYKSKGGAVINFSRPKKGGKKTICFVIREETMERDTQKVTQGGSRTRGEKGRLGERGRLNGVTTLHTMMKGEKL